jgi:hypothetical protein
MPEGSITRLMNKASVRQHTRRRSPGTEPSVFARLLPLTLEALSSRADANRNGLISVSELTGYLTRHVPGLTDGAQQPGVEMRFDGDVFVAGL